MMAEREEQMSSREVAGTFADGWHTEASVGGGGSWRNKRSSVGRSYGACLLCGGAEQLVFFFGQS